MLNFVLCDDNKNILDKLSQMLNNIFINHDYNAKITYTCDNSNDLFNYLNENTIDVLFLDINLKDKLTGLDIAEQIRKKNKKIYIISLLKSKDYKTIIKLLVQENNGIYIFTTGNSKERYWNKEILKEEAIKQGAKNVITMNLEGAIKKSFKEYKNYTIFVIGSFYIYGDVINYIQNNIA